MAHHAGFLIDIYRIGADACTPYEQKKGERFLRPFPEIGDCMRHLKPQSAAEDKLDTGCENVAGVREESGEMCVLNEKGATKGRSFNRRPEEERMYQTGRMDSL